MMKDINNVIVLVISIYSAVVYAVPCITSDRIHACSTDALSTVKTITHITPVAESTPLTVQPDLHTVNSHQSGALTSSSGKKHVLTNHGLHFGPHYRHPEQSQPLEEVSTLSHILEASITPTSHPGGYIARHHGSIGRPDDDGRPVGHIALEHAKLGKPDNDGRPAGHTALAHAIFGKSKNDGRPVDPVALEHANVGEPDNEETTLEPPTLEYANFGEPDNGMTSFQPPAPAVVLSNEHE